MAAPAKHIFPVMRNIKGKSRFASFLLAACSTLMMILLVTVLFLFDIRNEQQERRLDTIREMSLIRTRLEGALNARLLLIRGLVGYVEVNPDMTSTEFQSYASRLLGTDPLIRNVGLLKGTVVQDVYPRLGNEKILGVDLATIPAQQDDVLRVLGTKQAVTSGLVDLLQGGQGFIFRIPILIEGTDPEHPTYWGQASMVIRFDQLLSIIQPKTGQTEISYAISKEPGHPDTFLWGNASLLAQNPEVLPISLPDTQWYISALPASKGVLQRYAPWAVIFLGYLLSLLMGFLFFRLAAMEKHMRNMAFFDALTGLPNRTLLFERFSVCADLGKRNNTHMGVVMLDLDHFKQANDTYGHDAGDRILKLAAERLVHLLRSTDTVCRLGGDEFVVLLPGLKSLKEMDELLERIHDAMNQPYEIDGLVIQVGASHGASVFPGDDMDLIRLMNLADKAMYASKTKKRKL